MKKTRRILTVILAVIMLLSIVPGVSASAMTQSAFNSKVSSFKSTQYSNNSTYKNNPSKTGGYQCFGFANEMALYVFGSYPTNSMSASSVNSNWTRTYGGSGVDKLALGDIVRYACHSI
ncbi:MAG: hypothetical protein IJS17_00180, partial [Clostridia bacterium]|nr:hypothetical protein [Clostridia bacterium]